LETARICVQPSSDIFVGREQPPLVISLIWLHQVYECSDASVDESLELSFVLLGVWGSGVRTGK
jgi:hypothetical protein